MIEDSHISGEEAAEIAMENHYPAWDTLAKEESDLPERIAPHGPYVLVNLPTHILPNESPYELNEEKIEEICKSPETWNPIIAPLNATEDVADGWHRTLAAKKLAKKTIKAWIPLRKAKTLDTNPQIC